MLSKRADDVLRNHVSEGGDACSEGEKTLWKEPGGDADRREGRARARGRLRCGASASGAIRRLNAAALRTPMGFFEETGHLP